MASQPAKGKWYEVAESVFSWGDVWEGEPVTHYFQIKNTGPETLEIRDARADCHCTVPGNFDRYIAPGATGMVPFTFNSQGMQKFMQKGCTITTNDPERPIFRVYLQGFVKTVVELIPVGGGWFGKLTDPNELVESHMELRSNVEEPLKLQLLNPPQQLAGMPPVQAPVPVSPDHPMIVRGGGQSVGGSAMPGSGTSPWDIKVEEVVPGKKWNITLTTAPPLPAGYLGYQYRFSTGNPKLPVWTLSASAQRPERICADPPNMIFPPQFTSVAPPTVTVENYGTTPVHVTGATINNPDLTVKTFDSGGKTKVQVTAAEGYALPGPAKLTIRTDDPQIPTIEVNVYSIKSTPSLPPMPPKPVFRSPLVNQAVPTTQGTRQPVVGGTGAKAPG